MARFYKTPYVQNIPDYGYELPFNEILGGLATKQKRFDETAQIPDLIDDQLLKIQALFPEDKEYLENYRTNLYGEIDKLSTSVNGDYSQIQPQLKNIARQVNRDMTQGPLANIMNWTEQGKKYLEAKNKLATDNEGKNYSEYFEGNFASGDMFNKKWNRQYNPDEGLQPFNHTYVHSSPDRIKTSENIFGNIKADSEKKGYWNNGWTGSEAVKGITVGKIYKTAADNLPNLPENYKKELYFEANNADQDELVGESLNYLINYYGDPTKAKEELKNAIDLADKGDDGLLKMHYMTSLLGRSGERFMFGETESSSKYDWRYGEYMKKTAEIPTSMELYGDIDETSGVVETDLDKTANAINFDSKGNPTTEIIRSRDDKGNYTFKLGSTAITVTEEELVEFAKNNPALKDKPLYETSMYQSESGVGNNIKSIHNSVLKAYEKSMDVESLVDNTVQTIKNDYTLEGGFYQDPTSGSMVRNESYNFDNVPPKELVNTYKTAKQNLKTSNQFNITNIPDDKKLMNQWNKQLVTNKDIVGRNVSVINDKGFKGDGTWNSVIEYMDIPEDKFWDEYKNSASVVGIRPDGFVINMNKGSKVVQFKVAMAPREKEYFTTTNKVMELALNNKAGTIIIPGQDGNLEINYKPILNKNTKQFDHKLAYRKVDGNGNPITNYKNTSIEQLRSTDITNYLMSYGNQDMLDLLKALDYNTETDE